MDTNNTKNIITKRDWRWWDEDPLKLVKLETAFAYGAKDEEACAYAEITLDQLYYYTRKINTDFQVRKEWLKKHPILKARETVVKALKDNPWDTAVKKYKKGDTVKGVIIKYNKHGALASLEEGVAGLVHVSEFGSEEKLRETLELGKTYPFHIRLFEPKEQRMTLSFNDKEASSVAS